MSILDLLAMLLVFQVVSFGLYLAVTLVDIEHGKRRQDVIEKQINGHEKRQKASTEITDEQGEK